jgi:hypothetical protein
LADASSGHKNIYLEATYRAEVLRVRGHDGNTMLQRRGRNKRIRKAQVMR